MKRNCMQPLLFHTNKGRKKRNKKNLCTCYVQKNHYEKSIDDFIKLYHVDMPAVTVLSVL